MPNWQLAVLLLTAVFVGALLPVMFQLAATLRDARQRIRATGERVDRALDQSQESIRRVNELLRGAEGREHRISELLDSVGELAEVVHSVANATRTASVIGAAAGPAIASAVQAFRETMHEPYPDMEGGNGWDRHAEGAASEPSEGFGSRTTRGEEDE